MILHALDNNKAEILQKFHSESEAKFIIRNGFDILLSVYCTCGQNKNSKN